MGNTLIDPLGKDSSRPRGLYDKKDIGTLYRVLDDLADGLYGKRG